MTDRLVPLSARECWELLSTQSLGRLGLSVDALPAVLPVLYAVVDDQVLFRVFPETTMERNVVGSVVAFEADRAAPGTGAGWSVLVIGRVTAVDDARGRAVVEDLGLGRAGADGRLVAVGPGRISGRRLVPGGFSRPARWAPATPGASRPRDGG